MASAHVLAGWRMCHKWTKQNLSLVLRPTPIWGLGQDFYCCQTVAGLLMWDALSGERTGLSFTFATGPRQWSRSQVRVPRDSRPHFTLSDSRLSQPGGPGPRIYIPGWPGYTPRHCVAFSSLPTTRRARLEVFDPASTRGTVHATTSHNIKITTAEDREATVDGFTHWKDLYYPDNSGLCYMSAHCVPISRSILSKKPNWRTE
jgi:hypothetical protein